MPYLQRLSHRMLRHVEHAIHVGLTCRETWCQHTSDRCPRTVPACAAGPRGSCRRSRTAAALVECLRRPASGHWLDHMPGTHRACIGFLPPFAHCYAFHIGITSPHTFHKAPACQRWQTGQLTLTTCRTSSTRIFGLTLIQNGPPQWAPSHVLWSPYSLSSCCLSPYQSVTYTLAA